VGGGGDRGRSAGGRGIFPARVRPGSRAPRPALSGRRGAPDRADGRRGCADHREQRGRARARRRPGRSTRRGRVAW
jgi:hypothetical protein